MKDWIRYHKTIFTTELANGFSLYISVNIHESGKVTVSLNCSVVIGSFPQGLRGDVYGLSDILKEMSNIIRTKGRV